MLDQSVKLSRILASEEKGQFVGLFALVDLIVIVQSRRRFA